MAQVSSETVKYLNREARLALSAGRGPDKKNRGAKDARAAPLRRRKSKQVVAAGPAPARIGESNPEHPHVTATCGAPAAC